MRKLASSGESVEPPEDLTGLLIAATPAIGDGIFERTVVYLIEHNSDGALGVILNRPLNHQAGELLPRWDEKISEPSMLFDGGPVNAQAVIALGRMAPEGLTNSQAVLDDETGMAFVGNSTQVVTLDLDADPALTLPLLAQTRFFLGYAAWEGGQLEAEIAAGAWFVFDTTAPDVVDPDPETLRDRIFARQRGRHRIFANYPEDASFN